MSGRGPFWHALAFDDAPGGLNEIGLNENTIFQNYTSEERPSSTGPFIILRWSDQDRPHWQDVKAFERLTLWVHYPREVTTDYMRLVKILDRIDYVVSDLRDYICPPHPDQTLPGDLFFVDNYILSFVQIGSRSGDFLDDGFGTITKYAGYEVFSRQS